MKLKIVLAVAVAGAAAVGVPAAADPAPPELSGRTVEYSVLAREGVDVGVVESAVRTAGGTVTDGNAAVGLLTAAAPENGFADRLSHARGVLYVSRTVAIGHSPAERSAVDQDAVEKEHHADGGGPGRGRPAPAGMDPLDGQLWGLTSVHSDLARTVQPGDRRVKVGVLDTGVDGSHPDIAPNFDAGLSRNFTHDIPVDENGRTVDGPCEFQGCVDPPNWDDGGHGTHVAGTIAAAANGFGVSGVAPRVSIVNIRAGQDSGSFFLQPVVDALTYAGDAGLDVVNMSFFVDPWLYNCQDNPADTPEQQTQQRITVTAMTRALNYAHGKGVTMVASLGNEHEDSGAPHDDDTSPNFPVGTTHHRVIDNSSCLVMPVEGPHTIGVSAYGPSGAKADYSSYGLEHISVSAPGGYYRDYFGTPAFQTNENLILSAYPRNVGVAEGTINPVTGAVTPTGARLGVQKACRGDMCGYYQFLQGTSMASPHATGVAALIVSEYGRFTDRGVTMDPDDVRRVLEGTAFKRPCPTPRTVDYSDEGRDASFTATCQGSKEFNGFYGHGSVDAWSAVTNGAQFLR
ncbi:S8 family peptidase [Actinophytocola sp.]|uniref:S8 family peptidase n=1 Tax=Actinophytocola sp. TaxID=1872138 RepID=UPI00389AD47D